VQRGEGPARFIHTVEGTDVSRRPGFGSSYLTIAVVCMDFLSVPVSGELASDDGALLVPIEGEVQSDTAVTDTARLQLEVPFEEATLPPGGDDPEAYEDKAAWIESTHNAEGVVGSVSWEGTQQTEEYVVSEAHPVATFTIER
jgi:hypothetical protein